MIKNHVLFLLFLVSGLSYGEAETCISCHSQQVEQWQQSQHALSMQTASQNSILGDFNGGNFKDTEVDATFVTKNRQFFVNLKESGQSALWQVKYAFGVYPLQQYLIETGDGKLQALNIAWDSRPTDQGGQRWFRLDTQAPQKPGDPLHWRGVYQNWNSMCADCHSTALNKGYKPDQDRYETQYQQPNVSCSACHQSSQIHAAAAKKGEIQPAGLDLAATGVWLAGTRERPPQNTVPTKSSVQTETCGRCHALRTRLDQSPNGRINHQYSVNRLHSPLYFPDGRVREEVFVLGSFLQSKMHLAGVTCTNCHNPHSAKPKLEGNALCSQCHAASSFDKPEHHRHQVSSEGARCVSCHMPTRTYMQIDPRREHNFTTPNPQTAELAGSPDPCLACHEQEDRAWAIAQTNRLWPDRRERDDWFKIQSAPLSKMMAFIADDQQPPLYRASLIEQQASALANAEPESILGQLNATNPMLRESAWKAAVMLPVEQLLPFANSGLQDTQLTVRLAAFEALTQHNVWPEAASSVKTAYEKYLNQTSDRPAGRTLRARYTLMQNNAQAAEDDMRQALLMDHQYLPAYIMLSNILRQQHRLSEAVSLLSEGLTHLPNNAQLIHLRGLTQLQQKRIKEGIEDLKAAWAQESDNPDFGYRYALALYLTGNRQQSKVIVEHLIQRFPLYPGLAKLKQQLATPVD